MKKALIAYLILIFCLFGATSLIGIVFTTPQREELAYATFLALIGVAGIIMLKIGAWAVSFSTIKKEKPE